MDKAEYKRLGDYIREMNARNRDLKVANLLGVSMSKEFMPSIANAIKMRSSPTCGRWCCNVVSSATGASQGWRLAMPVNQG